MNVIHTAGHERGQIYIPFVNWMLAIATLAAVIGFGSSDALGGAYGIAVSLLMAITTLMATFVALHWKHNRLIVYTVNSGLLDSTEAVRPEGTEGQSAPSQPTPRWLPSRWPEAPPPGLFHAKIGHRITHLPRER
jgi:potassium transporter